ncbi:MAG: hypothetical protein DRN14_05465, partial [Thermoplasmata archaeon]
QGSTATVNGTLVHHVAETVANCAINGTDYDGELLRQEASDYIDKFRGKEEYDISSIESTWKDMGEALVKEYVINTNIVATELYEQLELIPNVYLAGTMDAIVSSAPTDTWEDIKAGKHVGSITVRDWKTASTKPSSFNYAYTLQAYCYAYLLTKSGVKIDNVELCFVVKATKTLPIRTFNFIKPFDSQAFDFIEGILKLIGESVQCFKDWPDMQYLLASDYRLKNNDIPRP